MTNENEKLTRLENENFIINSKLQLIDKAIKEIFNLIIKDRENIEKIVDHLEKLNICHNDNI